MNTGQKSIVKIVILNQNFAFFTVIASNQLLLKARMPSPNRKIYCGAKPKFRWLVVALMGNLSLTKKVTIVRIRMVIKIFLFDGNLKINCLFIFKYALLLFH